MSEGGHIVWIHESPSLLGGCEHYVLDCVTMLRERFGVHSTLLYGTEGWIDPQFVKAFDGAFPIVAIGVQLREIAPDWIYIHRLPVESLAREIVATGIPALRFFHDHKLFCLREHKYTLVGKRTCSRVVGVGCYPCGGFLGRGEGRTVSVRSLRSLRKDQSHSRSLAGYVVASAYMAEHLAAHGFARQRIHVAQLYVRHDLAAPANATAAAKESDLLLFVGRLTTGKGVDLLLQALALRPGGPRLEIVGDGVQRGELEKRTRELHLDGRVKFVGELAGEGVQDAYARASWLALPSRQPETFGLVGIEAMSRGLPVIATDAGGVREWLLHGRTGLLVPPNDVEALAAAVDTAFCDAAVAAELGRNAQVYCAEHFRPADHADKLMAAFRACSGASP